MGSRGSAERVAGRANSPVLAQGSGGPAAVKDGPAEIEEAYSRFTTEVNVWNTVGMNEPGVEDPRPSHRGEALPEWAIKTGSA